jgi:eukaryotic-like serine/threonine-protein kinase
MTTTTNDGHVVGGRYRLVRVLGRGGMGTVWQAHDELLHRDVAVKEILLPPELTDDERQVVYQRTFREARSAARISHHNVVAVFDVVEEDGRPWIVMEVVPSRSLAEIITEDGPLSPRQTARLGLEVLAALRVAHRVGVLHRDVKPSNVLIGPDDRVVLSDFGIATVEGDPSITKSGTLLGAAAYTAPERARGRQAEPKSDLWSLGATLYTAVEGRAPHDRGGALATLMAVLHDEPDPPRRAGSLWPVLQGLLRQDPAERLDASGAELMLRRVAGTAPSEQAAADRALPNGAAPRALPAGPSSGPPTPVPPGTPVPSALPATPAPPAAKTPAAELPAAKTSEPPVAEPEARAAAPAPPPAELDHPTVPPPAEQDTATGSPPDTPPDTRPGRERARPRRWRRRSTAVLLPVAVVGGALLAWTLWFGDPETGPATPDAATTRSAGPSPSQAPSPSGPAGTGTGGAGGPSGSAGGTAAPTRTAAAAAIPPGFRRYRDPSGFSLGVPEGWEREVREGVVYFRDPDSARFLLIDQELNPPQDMLADSVQQERNRRAGYKNYSRVRLERAPSRWPNTADWEFTYSGRQERLHVLIRSILPTPRRSYGLYWSTPDATWNENVGLFQVLNSTFIPAPG